MMTVAHATMAAPMSEPTKYRHFAHRNPNNPPTHERTDRIPTLRSSQPEIEGGDRSGGGREALFEGEDVGEEIAVLLDTLQDVGGLET